MSQTVSAFIGLGSNLDDPSRQVCLAIDALNELPGTSLLRASSLYGSAPVGYAGQPDYVNAVAEIDTELAPAALLQGLLAIEQRFGRLRLFRNAPRVLDLDLLLYGGQTCDEPELIVPHPRMHERAFVLLPLLEIAPHVAIPGVGSARELMRGCAGQRVERLPEPVYA